MPAIGFFLFGDSPPPSLKRWWRFIPPTLDVPIKNSHGTVEGFTGCYRLPRRPAERAEIQEGGQGGDCAETTATSIGYW